MPSASPVAPASPPPPAAIAAPPIAPPPLAPVSGPPVGAVGAPPMAPIAAPPGAAMLPPAAGMARAPIPPPPGAALVPSPQATFVLPGNWPQPGPSYPKAGPIGLLVIALAYFSLGVGVGALTRQSPRMRRLVPFLVIPGLGLGLAFLAWVVRSLL